MDMSVLPKIHEAREDVQVNSDIFYITLQLLNESGKSNHPFIKCHISLKLLLLDYTTPLSLN